MVLELQLFSSASCAQVPAKLDDFNLAEALGASPDGIAGVGMCVCKQKKVCGKKKTKNTPKAKKGKKSKKGKAASTNA